METQKGSSYLLLIVIAAVLAVGGLVYYVAWRPAGESENMEAMEEAMMGEEMMSEYSGKFLAGKSSLLLDFTKSDYEQAMESDKLVVLYFYANWCPICAQETAEALYPAFNELTTDQVVGIRVNYNDNQTDDDERGLAREFGVAYQHTKVFLKNGQRVLKSPEAWNKSRYLSEISKALLQ